MGRVLAITEFGELNEPKELVVLTSKRQYYYNVASNIFVDLTPDQVSHTILANPDEDSISIAGDHTATFVVGFEFPIVGGVNEGVYTTVSSSFGGGNTTIVVEEILPDEMTVAGAVVLASEWETEERAIIDYASLTDVNGHRLLVTNGSDTPRFWEGDTSVEFEDWVPAFDGFVTCKTLSVFAEHLFLGGVTTAVEEQMVVAWSDAGDFEEFEEGQAGLQILYQLDRIIAMEVLGDRLAIYSPDAVVTSSYVGGQVVFTFETVIPAGTRHVGGNALTNINVGHIYASQENFYLFDGTRGLRVLGDAIYSDYKGRKDHENLHRICALNDYAKRTLYWAVPDLNGGTMVYTVEYDVFDLSRMSWAREKYAHNPTAWGFFTNHTITLLWEDAEWEPDEMPWEDELGAWAEEAEQLEFPIRCFGTDEGFMFLSTEGVLTDDGAAAEQVYETMDFSIPEEFHSVLGRWGEIEFEASGTNVDVAYSKDLGSNWTSVETTTLSGSYTAYRLPIDAMSRTLRVRFSTFSNFRLRWCRLWVRSGGAR
jgi:hypothetical protein